MCKSKILIDYSSRYTTIFASKSKPNILIIFLIFLSPSFTFNSDAFFRNHWKNRLQNLVTEWNETRFVGTQTENKTRVVGTRVSTTFRRFRRLHLFTCINIYASSNESPFHQITDDLKCKLQMHKTVILSDF